MTDFRANCHFGSSAFRWCLLSLCLSSGVFLHPIHAANANPEGEFVLTSYEDLLKLFAQRPGSPIPRHELFNDDATGSERAIDVQINRLRRKIETDPSNPVYLQTVRGKGYILYTD